MRPKPNLSKIHESGLQQIRKVYYDDADYRQSSDEDFDGIGEIEDASSGINFTFDKVQLQIQSRVAASTHNSFDGDRITNYDQRSTNTYPMVMDHEEAQNQPCQQEFQPTSPGQSEEDSEDNENEARLVL